MKIRFCVILLICLILSSCNNDDEAKETVVAEKITLNHSALELQEKDSLLQLVATIYPPNTSNNTVVWKSADPSIAEVDSMGKVKLLKLGTTTITATTSNNKVANCSLTISPSVGEWYKVADFANGLERYDASAFVIGDKAFVGLGSDRSSECQSTGGGTQSCFGSGGLKNDFWEYDYKTDTWTQLKDFPGGARTSVVSFSSNGKGYVGLGNSYGPTSAPDADYEVKFEKDFWEYNPESDSWTQLADFPGGERTQAIGLAINDKGYVGSGYGALDEFTRLPTDRKNDFWEFDASNYTWKQVADYPGKGRRPVFGLQIGKKAYVGWGVSTPEFWEYSPETDSWLQKAEAPYPEGDSFRLYLGNVTGFSLNSEKGYFCFNRSGSNFWAYSPMTNTWSEQSNFPEDANFKTSFVVGGQAYIGTGQKRKQFMYDWQSGYNGSSNMYRILPED